jgi:hypothetical protein
VRSSLVMLRRFQRALGTAVALAVVTGTLTATAQPEPQPTAPPPTSPATEPPGPPAAPPWVGPSGAAVPPSLPPALPVAPAKPAPAPAVVLPEYPNFGTADPGVPKARANATMMYWGIGMTTGGLLVTIAGSIITASSIDVVDIYCDGPAVCLHRDDTVKKGIGSTMLVGGAIVGAIGFPLWLFGGRMVRVKPGARAASLTPDVRVGPASASASFAF